MARTSIARRAEESVICSKTGCRTVAGQRPATVGAESEARAQSLVVGDQRFDGLLHPRRLGHLGSAEQRGLVPVVDVLERLLEEPGLHGYVGANGAAHPDGATTGGAAIRLASD